MERLPLPRAGQASAVLRDEDDDAEDLGSSATAMGQHNKMRAILPYAAVGRDDEKRADPTPSRAGMHGNSGGGGSGGGANQSSPLVAKPVPGPVVSHFSANVVHGTLRRLTGYRTRDLFTSHAMRTGKSRENIIHASLNSTGNFNLRSSMSAGGLGDTTRSTGANAAAYDDLLSDIDAAAATNTSAQFGAATGGLGLTLPSAREAAASAFPPRPLSSQTARRSSAGVYPDARLEDVRPSSSHVLARAELLECDKIKLTLARSGVPVARGVLERALVAPQVTFSERERATLLPTPFENLAINPFKQAKPLKKKKKKSASKPGSRPGTSGGGAGTTRSTARSVGSARSGAGTGRKA